MDQADRHEIVQAIDGVIRERRTSLLMDPEKSIPEFTIAELIAAAAWAPNHKRTWPWSFTVITGESRRWFGVQLAEAAAELGLEQRQILKLPTKYLRSAVVLLVWTFHDAEDPYRATEDRDATAAAVQNLLLAATARGLASHWASVPEALHDATREFVGLDGDDDLVALVYLGWPTGEVPSPDRPVPPVTWLG